MLELIIYADMLKTEMFLYISFPNDLLTMAQMNTSMGQNLRGRDTQATTHQIIGGNIMTVGEGNHK